MFSRESLAKVGSQDHLLGFPRRFRGPSTWECNSSNKEYVIGVFCILKYNLLLIFIYLHFIILEMYPDTMSSWTYKYNAFKFKKLNKKIFFGLFYLKERGRCKDLQSVGLVLKWSQWTKLGQSKSGSQELLLCFPHGFRGLSMKANLHCFLRP